MKRLLWIFVLLLPLFPLLATAGNIVMVPTPVDIDALQKADFQLYHRTGEFWIGQAPEGALLPEGSRILTRTNPQAGELFRLLLASPNEGAKLQDHVTLLYLDATQAIFQATPRQLISLPSIRGEWIRITSIAKPMGYAGVSDPQTDDFHPFVQELVNQVSQMQYTDYVQTLQDFITRNTHSTGCDNAAAWILEQFTLLGLDAYYHDFLISGNTKHNVVGEMPGLLYPDSVIFITGHYDATAGNPYSAEPLAPGADDNGSGTAAVLECARILSQYNFEKTIRFVAFAGEEQGLYGSEAYVDDIPGMNIDVVGSFNYDMIAWSGDDPLPPDLVIYSDNNPLSQRMADKVAEAATTFVPTGVEPDVDVNPSMGSSDHGPFWDAGLPAICGIEEQAWGPDFNPYYHSVDDVITNCDLEYATNCTRVAIAALADFAVPIVEAGPYLAVSDQVIDEVVGNGNGAPDPGETISILVTLINVGDEGATGISATLTTTDPNLTITQNSATYPDLDPMETGVGSQPYEIDINAACPHGTLVTTELNITADGGYENSSLISFIVGDPVFEPTGPDAYGYLAYDPYDDPEYPAYEWIEISADSAGPGTQVNFTQDDQCLQFDLPFTFRYYGQDYTRFTIACNGWIGMGELTEDDYSNSGIPNDDGPAAMIAPYWEDLSPQRTNSGKVWQYYDSAEHLLIVEYNHVEQFSPTGSFETFQVILYDPAYHTTMTGDGMITFQYKDMSSTAQSEGTVGIESPAETTGLQYLYDGGYDIHAHDIENGMAILFLPPESIPQLVVELTYQSGSPVPAGGGNVYFDVYVENQGSTALDFDAWLEVSYEGGAPTTVVNRSFTNYLPGWSINRPNSWFPVPGSYSAGNYTLTGKVGNHPDVAWDESGFPFVKSGDDAVAGFAPWVPENVPDPFIDGEEGSLTLALPTDFAVHSVYPNPFNPATTITYVMPQTAKVQLAIYDISGRIVRQLIDGLESAGEHQVTFQADELASGIYFYRFQAGDHRQTGKVILLK